MFVCLCYYWEPRVVDTFDFERRKSEIFLLRPIIRNETVVFDRSIRSITMFTTQFIKLYLADVSIIINIFLIVKYQRLHIKYSTSI